MSPAPETTAAFAEGDRRRIFGGQEDMIVDIAPDLLKP